MEKVFTQLFWLLVALFDAGCYATIALRRAEPVNSAYLVIAAFAPTSSATGFTPNGFPRVLTLNDRRANPCEVHDDDKDFVKFSKNL